MRNSVLVFFVVLLLTSCKEKATETEARSSFSQGACADTFIYQSSIISETGTARMIFNDSSYSCSPLVTPYLIPGAGHYRIDGSTVTFNDTMVRVAIGDWSLAINGIFSYARSMETD